MTRSHVLLLFLALANTVSACGEPSETTASPPHPERVVTLDGAAQLHAGITVARVETALRADQTAAPGVIALDERRTARIGSLVDQIAMLCFQYDPATGKYGIYVIGAMRVLAGLMVAGFVTMYAILFIKSHRAKRNGGGPAAGNRPVHAGGAPGA